MIICKILLPRGTERRDHRFSTIFPDLSPVREHRRDWHPGIPDVPADKRPADAPGSGRASDTLPLKDRKGRSGAACT